MENRKNFVSQTIFESNTKLKRLPGGRKPIKKLKIVGKGNFCKSNFY